MFKSVTGPVLLAVALCLSMDESLALQVGTPAPTCLMKQFQDGSPMAIQAYRGQVVYLDFWASWCGPCLQSMPFMDEMQARLGERGLNVIALNLDEDPNDALVFLEQHPVKLRIASTEGDSCPTRYEVQAMPSSFLIDRQGVIRHIELGFKKGQSAEILQRVEALLAE